MRLTARLLAVMGMASIVGCSGDYRPANSPRIAMGIRGGVLTYYKDGKEYPSGFFGGGTIDAVQGNPRAVAEAEKGRDLVIGGFVVSIAGLGGVVGGVVVAAKDENRDDDPNTAALGLLLGGLGLSIVGSVLTASAIPHFYDAVAIYNDGVPMPLPAYGAPYPPRGYAPAPPPTFNPQEPPPPQSPQSAPAPAPSAPATGVPPSGSS